MDWNQVLGWGSPIGLGAFFFGLGKLMKAFWGNMYARRQMMEK